MSAIGAGCWTIGGAATNGGVPIGWDGVDPDQAYAGLVRAHEAGVTLFDTADVYGLGRSERLLGRLLAHVRRELLVISSKVGYFAGTAAHPYHPAQMRHQLETSLTNLGTDRLDVYFLHSADFGPGDRYLEEAVDQMRRFQRDGLIHAIGMRAPHAFAEEWAAAPHHNAQVQRFLELFYRIQPEVLTVRHNLLSPRYSPGETDIFAFAKRHTADVIIKQPLAQGLLAGTHRPGLMRKVSSQDHRSTDPQFTPPVIEAVHEVLGKVAAHFGDEPGGLVRAALRYALHRAPQAPVLVGFRNADQMSRNLTGLTPLTEEEATLLQHLTDPAVWIVTPPP
ncbi:aldo/keto reductase [Streptosporangium sp. NBC_01639]|uniref:aldo/keto reductase n=1 Tax=Streptosporangium sp. NBC_01639 TaxID=2975948 RepID=UPI003868FC6A|nr:aldo/keto reductase [Streptosporangium sp. NBC_01639]